jgi:aminoglycoside/choline kinase family phosphotransferase
VSALPAAISAFLAGTGWGDADARPLPGDASARRYWRLSRADGGSAILMSGPAEPDEVPAFLEVGRHLAAQGVAAPRVLAAAPADRLVLLEDWGPELLDARLVREPALEHRAYAEAGRLLGRLAGAAAPGFLPPYDLAWYLMEITIFLDWSAPAAPRAPLLDAWRAALTPLLAEPPRFVHRDFHAQNLFWLDGRPGPPRLGVIDFQGARAGHPAYDLVSLVEDARRDVSPAARAAALGGFGEARPELAGSALETAMAVLGAQRHSKILGLFDRLARRDGKPHYQAMKPRVRAHLERCLAHPALAEVRAWHARFGFGEA